MISKKDMQKLKKIVNLLDEVYISLYEFEDQDEVFNSHQALEVLENYSSITTSLDVLLYDLYAYFEELTLIHE